MLTRRHFLTHSCSLGIASATVSSSLLQLGLSRTAAAQSAPGYKALVCILLAGGNDSFNMLVPTENGQYAEYRNIRADLSLEQSQLLSLPGTASNGLSYGLHPGMPELEALFRDGDAALIANVGTLLEPYDAQAVENGTARLPLGLFSHSDQINQWQTAVPNGRIGQGWAGRIADIRREANVQNGVSMNISLSGSNVFQSGNEVSEHTISAAGDGGDGINAYDDGSDFGALKKRMVDDLLAVQQQNVFRREYSRRLRAAIDSQAVFVDALQSAPVLATSFSSSNFSQSLRQIARVIAARDTLGVTRQTFFVSVGGWDHHDDVLENQAAMLPAISRGLLEFRDALIELDMLNAGNDVYQLGFRAHTDFERKRIRSRLGRTPHRYGRLRDRWRDIRRLSAAICIEPVGRWPRCIRANYVGGRILRGAGHVVRRERDGVRPHSPQRAILLLAGKRAAADRIPVGVAVGKPNDATMH